MTRMAHDLVRPPKARRGERLAVLSPSFAAAGAFPAVHEQAMCRLTEVTGLIPVEYPTTRKVGATSAEQALRRGELPRTAAPVTGRLRSPPYPAAAPASTTVRPSPSHQARSREDVTAT
jgi:hypothetical protein